MKIIPLNNHVLIEPVVYESFIAAQKETYEEKGVVLAVAMDITGVNVGDLVYFDSFRCAKYPSDTPDKFVWLVEYENIRAKDEKISE